MNRKKYNRPAVKWLTADVEPMLEVSNQVNVDADGNISIPINFGTISTGGAGDAAANPTGVWDNPNEQTIPGVWDE